MVEPILESPSVSRHNNEGNNCPPYPPPPTTLTSGNPSKVFVLLRILAPIKNPSSLMIASANPGSSLIKISGLVLYPIPNLVAVNVSMTHLLSLSPERFFL